MKEEKQQGGAVGSAHSRLARSKNALVVGILMEIELAWDSAIAFMQYGKAFKDSEIERGEVLLAAGERLSALLNATLAMAMTQPAPPSGLAMPSEVVEAPAAPEPQRRGMRRRPWRRDAEKPTDEQVAQAERDSEEAGDDDEASMGFLYSDGEDAEAGASNEFQAMLEFAEASGESISSIREMDLSDDNLQRMASTSTDPLRKAMARKILSSRLGRPWTPPPRATHNPRGEEYVYCSADGCERRAPARHLRTANPIALCTPDCNKREGCMFLEAQIAMDEAKEAGRLEVRAVFAESDKAQLPQQVSIGERPIGPGEVFDVGFGLIGTGPAIAEKGPGGGCAVTAQANGNGGLMSKKGDFDGESETPNMPETFEPGLGELNDDELRAYGRHVQDRLLIPGGALCIRSWCYACRAAPIGVDGATQRRTMEFMIQIVDAELDRRRHVRMRFAQPSLEPRCDDEECPVCSLPHHPEVIRQAVVDDARDNDQAAAGDQVLEHEDDEEHLDEEGYIDG